jgi:hypothetical protein
MLSLVLAAALQASPAAAPAEPPKAPPPTTVAPVTSEAQIAYGVVEGKGQAKGKRVCFNDASLGSKIPTKRCLDREEFERRQRDNREYMRKLQDDARAPIFK